MASATTRGNPMIMLGLIAAVFMLLMAIVLSSSRPAESLKPIILSSGDWPPYTGESLPNQGVATAVVDFVFKQMGYQTQIQFAPWALALSRAEQGQRNDQIRGVYPYMLSEQREKGFYLSDAVIDIAYAFFFRYRPADDEHFIRIDDLNDLERYAVITLQGYEYEPELQTYLLKDTCDFVDNIAGLKSLSEELAWFLVVPETVGENLFDQAFGSKVAKRLSLSANYQHLQQVDPSVATSLIPDYPDHKVYQLTGSARTAPSSNPANANFIFVGQENPRISESSNACTLPSVTSGLIALAYYNKPNIMLEAELVGQSLVANRFPELASMISSSEFALTVPHRVMFSKSNPDNLALRDQFNQRLKQLRENQQSYNNLISKTLNQINLANSVLLVAKSGQDLITGYAYDSHLQDCKLDKPVYFPKGTRAIIRNWSQTFLPSLQNPQRDYVVAEPLNGPLAVKKNSYCFAPQTITLQ